MQVCISNDEIIMTESLGLTLNRHLSDLLTPESSFTIMGKLSSLILINVIDFSDSYKPEFAVAISIISAIALH